MMRSRIQNGSLRLRTPEGVTAGRFASSTATSLATAIAIAVLTLAAGCQRAATDASVADAATANLDGSSTADNTASASDPAATHQAATHQAATRQAARSAASADERLPPPHAEPPVVVQAFLEASRSGQDELAMELLSSKAREATGREGLALDRAGKASMVFEVRAAEFPAEDRQAAYVPSVWREPASSPTESPTTESPTTETPTTETPTTESLTTESPTAGKPTAGTLTAGMPPAPTTRGQRAGAPAVRTAAGIASENGEPAAVQVTWILRRQAEGWRIAGMATAVANEAPLLINFEDPDDLRRIKGDVAGEP